MACNLRGRLPRLQCFRCSLSPSSASGNRGLLKSSRARSTYARLLAVRDLLVPLTQLAAQHSQLIGPHSCLAVPGDILSPAVVIIATSMLLSLRRRRLLAALVMGRSLVIPPWLALRYHPSGAATAIRARQIRRSSPPELRKRRHTGPVPVSRFQPGAPLRRDSNPRSPNTSRVAAAGEAAKTQD